MYGVLIALIPAFLVSLYFFGLGALIVTATSVAACLFFEWAIGKYLMKKPTTTICDGSAIITGCLLYTSLHLRRRTRNQNGKIAFLHFPVFLVGAAVVGQAVVVERFAQGIAPMTVRCV